MPPPRWSPRPAPAGNQIVAKQRHFLDLSEIEAATLRHILAIAAAQKVKLRSEPQLAGKTLAMIFEKPSTRTRVSFEVAITQLGGHAVILDSAGSQLSRGETVADTARTLSRYVDVRSEERSVGKEGRSRVSPHH